MVLNNSSYSTTDIIFFGDNSNVKTLTIVKNNGKVEYLTKSEEFDAAVFKTSGMLITAIVLGSD